MEDQTEISLFWSNLSLLTNPLLSEPDKWNGPIQVNDVDPGLRSQFFPHVAVDQTTGNIAVVWYDPRSDTANLLSEVFVGISTDGGLTFTNVVVSNGASDEISVEKSYADYIGVGFDDGRILASWADNSQREEPNPHDPDCPDCMDAFVAVVPEPGRQAQCLSSLALLAALAARRHASVRRSWPSK